MGPRRGPRIADLDPNQPALTSCRRHPPEPNLIERSKFSLRHCLLRISQRNLQSQPSPFLCALHNPTGCRPSSTDLQNSPIKSLQSDLIAASVCSPLRLDLTAPTAASTDPINGSNQLYHPCNSCQIPIPAASSPPSVVASKSSPHQIWLSQSLLFGLHHLHLDLDIMSRIYSSSTSCRRSLPHRHRVII